MRRTAAWLSMFLCVSAIGCSKTERGADSTAVATANPTATPTAIEFPPSWPYSIADTGVTAAHGMVATDAPLATHVGATVLRNG